MKNDRKIRVGQVRQVIDEKEPSYGSQYFIKNIQTNWAGYTFCELVLLGGNFKGVMMEWAASDIQEDIVVM